MQTVMDNTQPKSYLEIVPNPSSTSATGIKRSCQLIRKSPSGQQERNDELWFELDPQTTPPADDDCDSYLIANIMVAMAENRDIKVQGSVSNELLSNLTEYQAAWCKWLPLDFHKIHFAADTVRSSEQSLKSNDTLCAFSGGVDSLFSVWTHLTKKQGYRSQNITSCVLVHGFDIPLTEQQSFDNAYNRAKKTIEGLELNLYPIKTNLREVISTPWEQAFGIALAATLSNYKSLAGSGILGSGEPYDSLIIPWGSTPITDHLLSSDNFKILHDGASYNRSEKVAEILDWKNGINNLRVCWQGDLKDKNCGKCEKCVRTKLNFLVNNHPIPPAFEESDIINDIKGVKLTNKMTQTEWKLIYQAAKKNHINTPWVKLLPVKIYKPIINKHTIIKTCASKDSWLGKKLRVLLQTYRQRLSRA